MDAHIEPTTETIRRYLANSDPNHLFTYNVSDFPNYDCPSALWVGMQIYHMRTLLWYYNSSRESPIGPDAYTRAELTELRARYGTLHLMMYMFLRVPTKLHEEFMLDHGIADADIDSREERMDSVWKGVFDPVSTADIQIAIGVWFSQLLSQRL